MIYYESKRDGQKQDQENIAISTFQIKSKKVNEFNLSTM